MTPRVEGRFSAPDFAEGAESSMIGDGCAEVVLLLLNRVISCWHGLTTSAV